MMRTLTSHLLPILLKKGTS